MFKKCTVEDFERVNYKIEEKSRSQYESRFCPDISGDIVDYYKVENSYTNMTKRDSFAFEVVKCSPIHSSECKSDNDIAIVLDLIYFTMYYVSEQIQFGSNELKELPIKASEEYHS